jgi:hypothetical protein
MVNKKFCLGILVIVLVFGIMLSSCATQAASALLGPGNFYSDTTTMEKRGEKSNILVLGLFGNGWPKVDKVAKDNGITKIATVEHYSELGALCLWTKYTTIVTGE